MTTPTTPRFIVMTSSAQVRGIAAKYGRYSNVAVVETDGVEVPKMISERARHLVRIVRHYGACSVGTTDRCQFNVALAEANALAVKLNAEAEALRAALKAPVTIPADDTARYWPGPVPAEG
jgi:hypothetical protein